LSKNRLSESELAAIAAKVGSDCALFLHGRPVIMRGRGERIEELPTDCALSLSGRRVLLFKPSFGISTPWAYGRMAAEAPRHYLPGPAAEDRLSKWRSAPGEISQLLFNNMETVAFKKFVALPALLEQLRRDFGVEGRLSGSGSTCFVLLNQDSHSRDVTRMAHLIRQSWGTPAFVQETSLI
jgi:4-diphosphocytidyl-2-C-methyl-D-erythritol kinase